MAYLKSSVKNGLETPSERFLRRFLDQMTQQLYLLSPLLASLFSLWGGGVGCVEGWLRYRLLFAASKKLRTKRPGVYPLIEMTVLTLKLILGGE